MRILFLVSSMNEGGAQRVAATLCNAWAGHGHDVVLTPTYAGKEPSFFALDERLRVEWLVDSRANVGALLPIAYARKLQALRHHVVRTRPDVVVSFLTNVNVTALLALRGLEVPVVVCERTHPGFSSSSGLVLSRLRRYIYPWADRVCAQTQSAADWLAARIPLRAAPAVLPNPLPPELNDGPLAPLKADGAGRQHIVAMGRMVRSKQFDRLISIFAGLESAFADWDLCIWGDGPERSALRRQVREAGLTGRVHMPGPTNDPWTELRRAGLFAMTSAVEGFPNVLLEAMACGLPVVAFDCPGGPMEMTDCGRSGIVVPMNDEAAFASAMARFMGDAAVRHQWGREAAVAARERYRLASVLAMWDEVFVAAGVRS
jgi:glycosyltransferase involved in cell wall biosynthesis